LSDAFTDFSGDLPPGVTADLVSIPCSYDVTGRKTRALGEPCEMPVEVVRVRVHHSSDPSGHAIVAQFRCLAGHRWHDVGPADEVIDDGGAFA